MVLDITPFLIGQLQKHPSAQPRDMVKQCYQAAFGAEHLLLDIDAAKAYFDTEFSSVPIPEIDVPICEAISNDFSRVNLGAWKSADLPCGWLFSMFRHTATSGAAANAHAAFQLHLQHAEQLAASGQTPFSLADWRAYIADYDSNNPRPVHHSAAYREAERPAYRVVAMRLARLIPLLQRMHASANHSGENATVIAIDGQAASGKTTAATALANITGAGLIHMDDFFPPMELRTPERLAQPGGNVDYERFRDEALPHIAHPQAFSYPVFDCGEMRINGTREVAASRFRIVEGAYSCHPELGNYMHIRVFSGITPDEQMARIRKRNGDEMAAMFASRWIPMEESYFTAFSIAERADWRLFS